MSFAYTMSQIGANRFPLVKFFKNEFFIYWSSDFFRIFLQNRPRKTWFLEEIPLKKTLQMSNLSKLDQNLVLGTKNKQI